MLLLVAYLLCDTAGRSASARRSCVICGGVGVAVGVY